MMKFSFSKVEFKESRMVSDRKQANFLVFFFYNCVKIVGIMTSVK